MKAVTDKGKDLGGNIMLAATMKDRIKGLLGKNQLEEGEGLLIQPCKGIHTFFMKFPIDAIFLGKGNQITAFYRNLPPNRMTPISLRTKAVLELPAGTIDGSVAIGDVISFT